MLGFTGVYGSLEEIPSIQASKQSKSEFNKYPLMAPKLRDTPNQSLVVEKKRICWHNAFEKAIKQRDVVGSIASRKTGAYPPRKISRFVHERTWTNIYIFFRRLGKKGDPPTLPKERTKTERLCIS